MSLAQRLSPRSEAELRGDRWAAWRLRALRALPLLCSVALITALTWPIVRQANNYFVDWPVHLWILRHQGHSLLHDARPSLFLHANEGLFYPFFAFYGGTLYAIGGLPVALLGGAGRNGYALCWVLAAVMAYGGWAWLGRMAGLGRWAAQAPPALFLTSPYLVTLVYTRGDWPEYVAVCAIPLLVASGLSVLRSDRLRLWPGIALVVATVLFTGSHNLTALWGGTVLVVLALALCATSARARQEVSRKGAARVLGLVIPATLVNAWFLVPALAYQARTVIAGAAYDAHGRLTIEHTMEILGQLPLFTLDPFARPPFSLALPVFAMGWVVLIGAAAARRAWRTVWMRLLVLLGLLVALLVAGMVTHGALVLALPKPYLMIQFTYRLENYILLAIAGGVLTGLVLVRGLALSVRAIAYGSLVVVIALSVAGARHQIRWANSFDLPPDAAAFWAVPTEGFLGDYVDGDAGEAPPATLQRLGVPPQAVRRNRTSIIISARPGELVDSNLAIMPPLVRVEGARVVGYHSSVNGDVIRRLAVLRIDDDAKRGAAKITIRGARPWPVVLGQALTLLGVLGLVANVVLRRRRRAQRPLTSISSTR